MIGKITGTLIETSGTTGYIETASGLTYLVHIPPRFISHTNTSEQITLYTHLHVREDALVLYGFEQHKIYTLFLDLISISGVGPKAGFTISSYLSYEEISQAILTNDVDTLTRVPGLGKKTAMKIILELSQKMKRNIDISDISVSDDDQTIIDTLLALGFESQKVRTVTRKLPDDISLEEKIKEAIRLLSK